MQSILGDHTILSLLNQIEMEDNKKEEIREFLPSMNDRDRVEIIQALFGLLSLRVQKEIALRQAKMLSEHGRHPASFDWQSFDTIEEDVLESMLAKTA